MLSGSKIDDSKSVTDNSRVTIQLVASFTTVNYDCLIFTVQATGVVENDATMSEFYDYFLYTC